MVVTNSSLDLPNVTSVYDLFPRKESLTRALFDTRFVISFVRDDLRPFSRCGLGFFLLRKEGFRGKS